MEKAERYCRMDHAMKVNSEMELKMDLQHMYGQISPHILVTLRTMNLKEQVYSNGVTAINTKERGKII